MASKRSHTCQNISFFQFTVMETWGIKICMEMNFTAMAAKLSHQKVPSPRVLSCSIMDHAVSRTTTNGRMTRV